MPTVDINGVSLFYHDEGQGEPVLLVHGFPLSSEMYQPQRAALSARFRVITPDLRGFGRSDARDVLHDDMSLDVYADDLAALLDYLGVGQAIVGGMSMGGYVVFALLRRHPERVKGIILIDTKATADTEEAKTNRYRMVEKAQTAGAEAIAEEMLPKLLSEQTRNQQTDLVRFVRDIIVATPVEGLVGALRAMAARPDSTKTVATISAPTLIIVGSDDQLTPPAAAEEMQQQIAGAQLVVVRGAAHVANLERPEEVNRAIENWLAENFS